MNGFERLREHINRMRRRVAIINKGFRMGRYAAYPDTKKVRYRINGITRDAYLRLNGFANPVSPCDVIRVRRQPV